MNKLTLIRGIPGSGKSTIAKRLAKENFGIHIETDMYFMIDGEYEFDSSRIKEAHKWCQEKSENYIANGYNVYVSNTFTKKWEMEYYVKLAKEYNCNLDILEAKGNYGNIHNVPENVIQKMKERWEKL